MKRIPRKRTIPEMIIEPVVKRVKTSKSVEVPPKAQNHANDAEKIVPEKRTGSRSRNNTKTIAEPKMVTKTSKRRLQSVDKIAEKKKKVEEEKIPPVQKSELNAEERQKVRTVFLIVFFN